VVEPPRVPAGLNRPGVVPAGPESPRVPAGPARPGAAPAGACSAEVHLAGLRLAGRRVVVVGGGVVAARRVRGLLAAGADVVLVAPRVAPALRELTDAGRLAWSPRAYRPGDLDAAWYAVAATDDPVVNAAVAVEAEARRVFCVRADLSGEGTAVTPATGSAAGLRVGVLSGGAGGADPRRAAATRDAIVAALDGGRLAVPGPGQTG
jgi:uroporphyrin-III C-methyltransferase/precorrin-2 dehydrogenase/sirohydrochlorin ferrochelatase